MLQGILIVVAFLVVAALMMTKKIPTLLALPLMAVVICIIAGVPMFGKNADGAEIGWLTTVFEAGTVRMGSAIMATIFGAWLGQLMNKTGVTENIIKKSAELGGDRPLVVTLIMVVATAVLFTTLSGLGSIIMVGSIVLPILISVGVPAASAACIFLMAFTTGLACNIANWKSFASIFSLDIADIQGFEIYLMARLPSLPSSWSSWSSSATASSLHSPLPWTTQSPQSAHRRARRSGYDHPADPHRAGRLPESACHACIHRWHHLVPALHLAELQQGHEPDDQDLLRRHHRCRPRRYPDGRHRHPVPGCHHASVKEVLNPLLLAIVPTSRVPYIIFFAILAPLALYRGPMNMFGLGSGIAALIIGLGTLNPLAVMAAFLAAERIQCGGDPTNTQNVWTANFCEVDVNTCTKKMLPYLWAVSIVGVILGAMLYF